MSASFQVAISDKATPALRAKLEACAPARVNGFVGPRVARLVRRNFRSLPHNKRGWAPTNFWSDAARSTNWQVMPNGVMISVNKIGARQRYHGGHIAPVKAKALTIPVAEEAYGKVPANFGDQLKLVVIPGKGAWLALKSFEQRSSALPKKGSRHQMQGPALSTLRERLKFLFRLSAGVDQEANPAVLPSDADIASEAIAGVEEAVK